MSKTNNLAIPVCVCGGGGCPDPLYPPLDSPMEALRYFAVNHDLPRLLERSITACYVLMWSVAF